MAYQSSASWGGSGQGHYRSSAEREKDDLFYYFFHIDERDDYPTRFEEQWKRLRQFDWNPKQISNILHKTAEHIDGLKDFDPQRAEELKDVITHNWSFWEDPALKAIDKFAPINLSLVIQSHNLLGFVPSIKLKKAWLQLARNKASQYGDRDFVTQVHASASLGVFLPQIAFTKLLDRIQKTSHFLRSADPTRLAWAVAVHHAVRPLTECTQIASLLRSHMEPYGDDIALQKMQHDIALYFGWERAVDNPIQEETTSKDEKTFARILRNTGVNVRKESERIPGFNQAIDQTAEIDGVDVDLELDGPTHFNQVAGSPHILNLPYRGNDILRSRLLQKNAPHMRMLRIPHTISDIVLGRGSGSKLSEECRGKIAELFISKAAQLQPGLYRAATRAANKDDCPFIVARLIQATRSRSIHTP